MLYIDIIIVVKKNNVDWKQWEILWKNGNFNIFIKKIIKYEN